MFEAPLRLVYKSSHATSTKNMMIDLNEIDGFEWDEGNVWKPERHGVSQAEAEQVFDHDPVFSPDLKHSHGETRIHALGITDAGRFVHLTLTIRERVEKRLIRVISARPMNRKERRQYREIKDTEIDS